MRKTEIRNPCKFNSILEEEPHIKHAKHGTNTGKKERSVSSPVEVDPDPDPDPASSSTLWRKSSSVTISQLVVSLYVTLRLVAVKNLNVKPSIKPEHIVANRPTPSCTPILFTNVLPNANGFSRRPLATPTPMK
jgi:hypothetical protein